MRLLIKSFPKSINCLWCFLAPISTAFSFWVVYERTWVTWTSGGNRLTWLLASGHKQLFLIGALSFLASAVWLVIVSDLIASKDFYLQKTDRLRYYLLLGVVLLGMLPLDRFVLELR